MGKKELLANILYKTGLIPVIRKIPLNRNALTIIAYHRIYDIDIKQEFPFDPELISASVDNFEWQMKYIKKYSYPSRFSEVITNMQKGRKIHKRTVIVTFDDGHQDNYKNAFPILKNLRMPATIFLSTGYIGKNDLFWFDEVAYLIYRANSGKYSISAINTNIYINNIDTRRKATEKVLGNMKNVGDEIRREALMQLRKETKVTLLEKDKPMCGNLTWAQVKEMSKNGIEFGSHTVSHPILTKVGDMELMNELIESRRIIEEKIKRTVQVLAYPVGGKNEYDNRVKKATKDAGYIMGVSYISGINKRIEIEQYDLKRLHVERYTRKQDYLAMLELPILFS